MNRIFALALTVALAVGLASCGGGSSLSQEQAEEAFILSYSAVIVTALMSAFGEAPEGATMDAETGALTFDKMDMSDYGSEYTTISGTAKEKDGKTVCELTLEGGAVSSVSFELGDIQGADSIKTTMKANGKSFDVELDAEQLKQPAG
jgi:hypothetical protein